MNFLKRLKFNIRFLLIFLVIMFFVALIIVITQLMGDMKKEIVIGEKRNFIPNQELISGEIENKYQVVKITEENIDRNHFSDFEQYPENIRKALLFQRLEQALVKYFENNQKYPVELESLVPEYLENLSKFLTEDNSFTYKISNNQSQFKLEIVVNQNGAEMMQTDGGVSDNRYELGSDLSL